VKNLYQLYWALLFSRALFPETTIAEPTYTALSRVSGCLLSKLLHKLLHLLTASIACAQTYLSMKAHSLILALHFLRSQAGKVLSNAEAFTFTISHCLHHMFQKIMSSSDKAVPPSSK